ncbi:hypothetical protein BaRGS_00024671 [Batillaria attramentaria]|uniref:Uncharacterized protein n=1 Tax=Batillaria attramentaria TaxID=370345 RepID=A0ABD0KAA8_9CAEN
MGVIRTRTSSRGGVGERGSRQRMEWTELLVSLAQHVLSRPATRNRSRQVTSQTSLTCWFVSFATSESGWKSGLTNRIFSTFRVTLGAALMPLSGGRNPRADRVAKKSSPVNVVSH